MRRFLLKICSYLDGHKSWICFASISVLEKLIDDQIITKTKLIQIILTVLWALGGGSLAHKSYKKIKSN